MSDETPVAPATSDLRTLLLSWINTETWEESKRLLETYAGQFLNDEALHELETLLAESNGTEDGDESRRHTLRRHLKLLEMARAESIEAAYVSLLHPVIDLSELPTEIETAIQALLSTNTVAELLEQLTFHAILLAPETAITLETLLEKLRQTDQNDAADYLAARYALIQQVKRRQELAAQSIPEELLELLQMWMSTHTWGESMEFFSAHAEGLLSNEAQTALEILLAKSAGEDEALISSLLTHRAILQQALAGSIEAAYIEVVKLPLLDRLLLTISGELRTALRAFLQVGNSVELRELLTRAPILLAPEATTAIDSLLDQLQAADEKQAVEFVRERYVTLKQMIEANNNPFNIALQALLQATSPAKLYQVVAQYPILLEDETLDRLLEIANEVERAGDTIMAPRLRLRVGEVQHFKQPHEQVPRTVAPEGQQTVEYENAPGMRIESDGGSISGYRIDQPTINNIHIEGQAVLERRWQEPAQQVFDEKKPFVGRRDKLDEATKYLTVGEDVAIVGKTRTLALQGLAGIGKTYMARKLGVDLYDHFGHRVFWLDFGNKEVNEQILLGQLARWAFGGVVPSGQLDVEQVRSWLQETIPPPARFLVVFDDVWPQAPLGLLSRALPANAVRLITTRNRVVAQGISRKVIELDRLDLQDGLELLEDRLSDQDDATYHDDEYHENLKALVDLLDGHALALEIAAAMIRQPVWIADTLSGLREGIGQGRLDHLRVPEDRDLNLERSLALSYERMAPEQRSRFRALGVFAPETPITSEAAAAVWGLQGEHALRDASLFLRELADLAFLVEREKPPFAVYRQHGLLQVYAHAFLKQEQGLTGASWAHAQYYTELVLHAETATPRDYPLLDLHIQNLLAALKWTLVNEPLLFSRLVEVSMQFLLLRGQLHLLREYLPISSEIARTSGNIGRQANVLKSLGDLERRLGNVQEARGHYDAALPLYQREQDRLGEANIYMSLADMFLAQRDWQQARDSYEQALPLFVAVHDPLGQANTLIDLGLARFALGEQEQGMSDIQQARELFSLVQNEEWVRRAEQRLAQMQASLKQSGGDAEIERIIIAFAGANWAERRQMLTEHKDLLSEQVESVLDRIVAVNTDTDVIRLLEDVRTLLRRCRTWGSDAIFFFEQRMRLGDGIVIPPPYEPDVMQVASLLVQQSQDTSAYEQAVQILTGLLNRLTADTSPLFEGALLRDLAELLSGLPGEHPARKLEQIETYYREALPLYQAAGRQISVAMLQRSLGNILSEQGRYAEALELLQVAIQGLQGEGNYQHETAWALSSYASTLDALGSTEEALDAYIRAIALLPDTPALLRNRAETHIHARRLVEAESDLERAVELDGNEESSYLWFRRAQIAIARGDGLSAEQMLDEVVKRSLADDNVVFARAQSAWLRGELATAQDWFQRAINVANPGKQATMRGELEILQAEHPNLPRLVDV